jgi:predicted RNA binding protein YcfA (HicA-like mRNA interferase family)
VSSVAKLRPLPQRKVIEILRSNGFEEVRSGKHITFKKKVGERMLTTWVPHHREVTVFVIQYIIKQTEKERSEFE